jgi:hypothetical protein
MAMTGIGYADAAGKIKLPPTIRRVDIRSLGAISYEIKDPRPGRSHVSNVFDQLRFGGHACSVVFLKSGDGI